MGKCRRNSCAAQSPSTTNNLPQPHPPFRSIGIRQCMLNPICFFKAEENERPLAVPKPSKGLTEIWTWLTDWFMAPEHLSAFTGRKYLKGKWYHLHITPWSWMSDGNLWDNLQCSHHYQTVTPTTSKNCWFCFQLITQPSSWSLGTFYTAGLSGL